MNGAVAGHGALMDRVYRRQKHIYDLTRKFYLFGRDRLIAELDARPGASVLELGCGTGRNLAQIGARWPRVALHGLDISREMLATPLRSIRLHCLAAPISIMSCCPMRCR
jgi:S-adenosylmethionine-diacylgycerolhomoserine-N-methlytransferase